MPPIPQVPINLDNFFLQIPNFLWPIHCIISYQKRRWIEYEVHMKIGAKLLFIVITLAVLLSVTALSGVLWSSRLLQDQMKDKYMAVSSSAMEKIHRLFHGRYQDVRMLANEPVITSRASTPAEITRKLREYKGHFRSSIPYASLSFFDLQTRKRIADTDAMDIGVRAPLTGFWNDVSAGREFVLDVSPPLAGKEPVFHFAQVVKDNRGMPFGLVVARMPGEALHDIVSTPLRLFNIDAAFDMDLLDRNGLILYSTSNREGMLTQTSPAWNLVNQAKTKDTSGALSFDNPQKERAEILFYAREEQDSLFRGNEWTLVMSLSKDAALAPILELRNRLVLIIAVIVFCAVAAGILLSRTITKPIVKLSNAVAEVGKGRLDVNLEVKSRDEIGMLTAVFNTMVEELRTLHGELRTMAVQDALTGAYNRNKIEQILQREIERASRYRSPLSLLLFDLDHFKNVNDTYGHLSGDYVLRTVIGIIRNDIRSTDALGRWGGEEFMLVAPETDREQAAALAEKIREHVVLFGYEGVGMITISCGLAVYEIGETTDSLIRRADDALYRAKRKGRNRVEVLV